MEANVEHPAVLSGHAGGRVVIGVFFAVLGVLLTLDNLDVIDAEPFLRYWSLVLIALGALKLTGRGSRIFAILLIVAGGWILAYNLELMRFTLFDLWPLLLIGAGIGMVARAMGFRPQPGVPSAGPNNILAILSSPRVVEGSTDYSGGSIVAFLGGCKLDLTNADISTGPAVIDALAIWGGIEIFVPDDWEVTGEVVPVMGGFEIKSSGAGRRLDDDTKRRQLIVRGVALMGGIEVKSTYRGNR